MPLQNFLIAPLKSGIQTNRKPWLIADDAYQKLRNVYTWRGRVKKRIGARVMDQTQPVSLQQQFTRLRINIGTTDGAGNFTGFVPRTGNVPNATPAIGQMFSITGAYFTVVSLGTPGVMLSTSATATIFTYDTSSGNPTSGQVIIAGASPATIIYFYPALPVMHIGLYDSSPALNETTVAFDTRFSYTYTQGIGWQRLGTGLWSGTDHDFHSTANWQGTVDSSYFFFVVNNVAADGIQYFDGANWITLAPPLINAAGTTLLTALQILVFKGFMIAFGPTLNVAGVGVTVFANQARWAMQGSPIEADSWRDDIPGLGGFDTGPTKEAIVSVQPLKDRIIVFFQYSTYELVYTGNLVLPFEFQKINTELGVESTHSTIPFDRYVLGMGSTGIHACNGLNVERIDQDIPTEIFDIANINSGPLRTHGIRDYYEELAYWTYPSDTYDYRDNNVYPNQILVLDYVNSTWATFDDSITTFGYFFLQNNYLVWQNIFESWENMNMPWNYGAGFNLFRSVLAGNQEGWTFLMTPDLSTNSMSLQITFIANVASGVQLTVINHNISPNAPYVFINNIKSLNNIFTTLNGTIQQANYVDANTIQINIAIGLDLYTGGGTLERVSEIEILTKQYNFFPESGKRCFIGYVDFYVDRTPTGVITVDYLSSASEESVVDESIISGTLLGTNILETSAYPLKPYELQQSQFWHRIYFQQDGEVVQLHLYMTPNQILSGAGRDNGFVINAVQYYAEPTAPLAY